MSDKRWTQEEHDAVRFMLQAHADITDRSATDGCACGYGDPRTWDHHTADRILDALEAVRQRRPLAVGGPVGCGNATATPRALRPCPDCKGTGDGPDYPCDTCHGSGADHTTEESK